MPADEASSAPRRSTLVLWVCAAIAAVWVVMTLAALGLSIVGGHPLYVASPGPVTPVNLSLFGKVYLGASMLMPFLVIVAIASA